METKESKKSDKKDAKKKDTVPKGEQIPLIDVGPKNLKKIIPVAKQYRAIVKDRLKLQEEEAIFKNQLQELIEDAGLQRDKKGKVQFVADGMTIIMSASKTLIQVKDHKNKD